MIFIRFNLDNFPVNVNKIHFNIFELLLENEIKQTRIQKLETEIRENNFAAWKRKLELQIRNYLDTYEI
jgi:hypothetical protein